MNQMKQIHAEAIRILGKKLPSLTLPPKNTRGAWKARGPQLDRKLTLAGGNPQIFLSTPGCIMEETPKTDFRH